MLLSTLYANDQHLVSQSNLQRLKTNLGLGQKDCQHIVIDEFLCMGLVVLWEQMYATVQGAIIQEGK